MDIRSIAKATLVEIKADDVPSLAAGVAFKIFLAIFPSLIAVVAVFCLVTSAEDLPRLLD
jgi:membrane protein